ASITRRRKPSPRIWTPPKRLQVGCRFGCHVKRFLHCCTTTASGIPNEVLNSDISAGASTQRSPMDSDMKKLLTSFCTIVAMLVTSIAAAQWSGSSSAPVSATQTQPPQAIVNRSSDYVVGVQDLIKITVFDEPTMSGSYRVDTDGSFQYPMLGRVAVGGMRIREVEQMLKTKLEDGYIKRAQVAVDVEQFRSRSIFVVGEVRTPGKYPMTAQMSLIEALAAAGSTTAEASSDVMILRPAARAHT